MSNTDSSAGAVSRDPTLVRLTDSDGRSVHKNDGFSFIVLQRIRHSPLLSKIASRKRTRLLVQTRVLKLPYNSFEYYFINTLANSY